MLMSPARTWGKNMCSTLKINEELSKERESRQSSGWKEPYIYNSRLGEWGLYSNCHVKLPSGWSAQMWRNKGSHFPFLLNLKSKCSCCQLARNLVYIPHKVINNGLILLPSNHRGVVLCFFWVLSSSALHTAQKPNHL